MIVAVFVRRIKQLVSTDDPSVEGRNSNVRPKREVPAPAQTPTMFHQQISGASDLGVSSG
jgi:hypothetical protein